jgi:hypothetical protein
MSAGRFAEYAHGRATVLVYRHQIAPRSKASVLRLQYVGFERLSPVWVGCDGAIGVLDRALFKQFGTLPPRPDLNALEPRVLARSIFRSSGSRAF